MSTWEEAKSKFTEIENTTDPQFWVKLFRDQPGALHSLLYDIYSITKAQAEGKGKGRRAKVMDGSLEELFEMVLGK